MTPLRPNCPPPRLIEFSRDELFEREAVAVAAQGEEKGDLVGEVGGEGGGEGVNYGD